MQTKLLLPLVFIALVATSYGQSLSTSVGSGVNPTPTICQKSGTAHAACAGTWKQKGGIAEVSGGGVANASYGKMTADARIAVNCSIGCNLGGGTVSSSGFSDIVNVEGAPTTGAYLLVRVAITGSLSSASSTAELQLNINGNTAQCAVSTSVGSCVETVPVESESQSFDFTVSLIGTADGSVTVSGEGGTDTEYAELTGKVTRLAVVNDKRQVLKDVVITTGSGHVYPD